MAETPKCPELQGTEFLKPGYIAGRMVCGMTDAPTPQEMAKNPLGEPEYLPKTLGGLKGKVSARNKALQEAMKP
ncbi:MAG: hypothetical protein Q8K26_03240 [Candidatus Gracilibacteria bacterium]|nr:hypothetical protein [Candidatus Gracilibacteria bacterium]